eukprot:CAMPEP_0201618466 /NCGR_PEP_ID=MMETSP0492-20130828/39034_1 /ASSEMBLY_ACC=CAM_ASM_000837 /TAXON_ID=420259 /ORGANISM="Thalassiosira gravida, Strain GMp14c1" /LENGTH=38 /DNA_ID= /DNA_START= /DNA_END= /DNA_ORIENTATION=
MMLTLSATRTIQCRSGKSVSSNATRSERYALRRDSMSS